MISRYCYKQSIEVVLTPVLNSVFVVRVFVYVFVYEARKDCVHD